MRNFIQIGAMGAAAALVPLVWAGGFILASLAWKTAGSVGFLAGSAILGAYAAHRFG